MIEYNSSLEELILKIHNGKPPDEVVLAMGGCPHCAMTGYEDYPTGKVPCRLGHINEAEQFAEQAKSWGSASSFSLY